MAEGCDSVRPDKKFKCGLPLGHHLRDGTSCSNNVIISGSWPYNGELLKDKEHSITGLSTSPVKTNAISNEELWGIESDKRGLR